MDAVTFTVATNPGAPAGPLNRIASGGELGRFLLALKVCLTGNTPGLTLILTRSTVGSAAPRRMRSAAVWPCCRNPLKC